MSAEVNPHRSPYTDELVKSKTPATSTAPVSTSAECAKTDPIYPRRRKTVNSGSGGGYGSGEKNSGGPGSSGTNHLRRTSVLDRQEAITHNAFTPVCYIQSLILSCIMTIVLVSILIYIFTWPDKPTTIKREQKSYAMETSRKMMSIASENIDCSIFLKVHSLGQESVRNLMLLGMMCLHLTEPHSVAPDSAYTGLLFRKMDKFTTVDKMVKDVMDVEVEYSQCVVGNPKNINCTVEYYPLFMNAHVNLKGDIMKSDYFAAFATGPNFFGEYLYYRLFAQFIPQNDQGMHEFSAWTFVANRTNLSPEEEERRNKDGRVLTLSRLGALFAKNNNVSQGVFDLLEWKKPVKPGMIIKASLKNTRHIMNHYLFPRIQQRKMTKRDAVTFYLRKNVSVSGKKSFQGYKLLMPKGPTASALSAFVVKVVHGVLVNSKDSEDVIAGKMYGLLLIAQRLAHQLLPDTRDWTGYGTRKWLMDEADRVIDILLDTKEEEMDEKMKKITGIRKDDVYRVRYDRVTSLVFWKTGTHREVVFTSSMGLPEPYDSYHFTKKKQSSLGRFYSGNDFSRPFTSASTLYIIEHDARSEKGDHSNLKPVMAVTSCGSIRTVESTATAMLRMILLNNQPGKAVASPGVFYDPRHNKYYCDKGDEVPRHQNAEFKKQAQKIRDFLKRTFKIECNDVDKKDFMGNDRVAIAKRKDARRVLRAAIDPRHKERNIYPPGY